MFLPLLSSLSFFFGIIVALPIYPWMGGGVLLLFLLKRWRLSLICATFLLGMWRVQVYESQLLSAPVGEYLELSGEIITEVDRRQDHQKVTVLSEYGRILVRLSPYVDLNFGDEIKVSGVLDRPSEDIEGFNYAEYLSRYRVWLVMNRANVEVLSRAPPSVRGALYQLKTWVELRLNELYMEPEASFVAGLLLGSRKGMPAELADAFQKVGLTHIVAISGYNITLVITGMFLFFQFLSLKWRVVVSTVAIILFVILVGASAAVVRAGIMGGLTLWALFTGRKSQVFFALLWSAVLMVLINPYTLLYDVGFQLSFASTLGLLVCSPMLEKFLPNNQKTPILREAFVLTLSAQIATTPLILFHFGRLSWISPFANLLAAPFLAPAMMFGALSVIFGQPMAMVAWVNLRAVELIAIWISRLPWIEIPFPFSFPAFLILNLLLLWISLRFYKREWVRAFFRGDEAVLLWASYLGLKKHVK